MSLKGFKRVGSSFPSEQAGSSAAGSRAALQVQESRRDPTAALAAAATVAPTLPPTRIDAPALANPVAQLNLKVRTNLIDQLAHAAAKEETTQKVIVCRALAAAGFEVDKDDLADRGKHRRRR